MGLYKYVRDIWKKPKENLDSLWTERLIQWRREPSTLRLERPTRIDRARSLGYRAKQGIIVVRQRVTRGGHYRSKPSGGRRPSRYGRRKNLDQNYQSIAEQRANKKYINCEVLNSYYVAKDGQHYWYEIILVDKNSPSIVNDKTLGWISEPQHTGRVHRGLTSAGRKSRGLRNKGAGAEKLRPSRTADLKRRSKKSKDRKKSRINLTKY